MQKCNNNSNNIDSLPVNKFDRFKLAVPSDCVTVMQPNCFTRKLNADGVIVKSEYEQTVPFYYHITVDESKSTVTVEFSGKALLEDYSRLIDVSSVETCIRNINRCEVCEIDWSRARDRTYVLQCDVTYDLSTDYSIPEIQKSLMLSNSSKWNVSSSTRNRFSITNTAVTHRKQVRMVVYDKGLEMNRSKNAPFIKAVSNPEEQLEYFDGKIRLELNLNSVDRIRRYLSIENNSLSAVLNSKTDAIRMFLNQATTSDDVVNRLIKRSPNMRTMEHLLLLALCSFDIDRLRSVVYAVYSNSDSASRAMKPYKELIAAFQHNDISPNDNHIFNEITDYLRHMLASCLPNPDTDSHDLLSLYQSAKDSVLRS